MTSFWVQRRVYLLAVHSDQSCIVTLLCSVKLALAGCDAQASPIVRVAVESARPAEMPQLEEGLRLLNRADPFVEVSVLDSGEYVIGAAGDRLSIGSAALLC